MMGKNPQHEIADAIQPGATMALLIWLSRSTNVPPVLAIAVARAPSLVPCLEARGIRYFFRIWDA
jgi:hypothetical protein